MARKKMDRGKIKKDLLKEINQLKDKKYGYIKAGLPSFARLFGRDSLIAAWELLDYDTDIAKHTLKVLAKFQGKEIDPARDEEPGKILHEHQIGKKEHPNGYFPFPYYGSVDSTPLFLILSFFYFQKTKKAGFIKEHWPNILMAVNWLFNFGDRDGDLFLEYKRRRKTGLFHQGWKDSFQNHLGIKPPVAIVEAQGYQYLALLGTARLAREIFNDRKLEKSLLLRAKELREAFNKKFWLKKERYFALALNKKKEQRKAVTSSPGHLLFTGIIEKKKVDLVIKRLFEADLWTPYGIRTHSSKEPDFDSKSYHLGSIWPHDNWIIAQGLKRLGYKKKYQEIKKALFRAYHEIGFIPEFYGVSLENKIIINGLEGKPCHPQAWASGALFNFLLAP